MAQRAGKVGNIFFILWGPFCALLLAFGLWMLVSGLQFRADYRHVQGQVILRRDAPPPSPSKKKSKAPLFPYVRFRAGEETIEIPAPRQGSRKELSRFQKGSQVDVWYPADNPQAVQYEGDRGVLMGGMAFTGVGVLFLAVGILMAVAEFYPNRFLRFGEES
jgi:hypothetical protein